MKKQSNNKSLIKKKAEKPTITEVPTNTDGIIKSQLNLFQFCNSLSTKMHGLELSILTLKHETISLKKENEELKRILELIGKKITEVRDRMNDEDCDIHPNDPKEKNTEHGKSAPLHDDVITRCEMCEKIYHIKSNQCPFCGFKKINKEGK